MQPKPGLYVFCILLASSILSANPSVAQKKNKGVGEIERQNPKFAYSPDRRDSVTSTGLIALLYV
jgi:hypothetical protein